MSKKSKSVKRASELRRGRRVVLNRMVSLRGKLKALLTIYREYEDAKIEAIKRQDFEEASRCIKQRQEAADVVCKELLKQANAKDEGHEPTETSGRNGGDQ